MPDEPLHTTTYTLTRADALAYEQAASRLTPLGVLALLLWLGLWGGAALLIPAGWAGPRFGMNSALLISVMVAIAYVLALLLISVRQWLRARRRLKRTLEVTLSEWPDRLDLVSTGMPRQIGFSEIRRSILGRTHLFLDTDEDVLILPRSAFPEEGSIEDLARRIDGWPRPVPHPAPVDAGAAPS
ncbi:MAG: hypothetical protein ABI398_13225 [Devosia sp.]